MQDHIANLVHEVLIHGLRLRERADAGEPVDLENEQATLKKLVLEPRAQGWADYAGEGPSPDKSILGTAAGLRRSSDQFLGIRYALVCWLDEIMIDSPLRDAWNDRKLETELYGTNMRAEEFWRQAKKAEAKLGSDAAEVYFLCSMLGFRGEMGGNLEELHARVSAVQTRIGRAAEPPVPPEREAATFVPPRRGRERMQTMVLVWAAVLLLLVPVAVFFLVQKILFNYG
jgi:type VI secretion system protein ImpK